MRVLLGHKSKNAVSVRYKIGLRLRQHLVTKLVLDRTIRLEAGSFVAVRDPLEATFDGTGGDDLIQTGQLIRKHIRQIGHEL